MHRAPLILLAAASSTACNRRRALALLGASLLPLLSGCTLRHAPVAIAAHPWPGYELLRLALREGWLPHGQVRLLETVSASDSLQALRQGTVDGAALTLDEVLRARADGVPLTIVLVFDVSAGADAVLVRPAIRSLRQLAGKRIAVEQSALGALVLHLTLQAAGLSPSQVTVVPVTPDRHVALWQAGKVDALVTYEPVASQLVEMGAHRIIDSRYMPGMIFDVLAIRTERLRSCAKSLQAVVAGHFQALHHLEHNPQDAAYRMAGHLKLSQHQVLEAFGGLDLPSASANYHYLGGAAPELLTAARMLNQVMVGQGMLRRSDSLAELVSVASLPHEVS